MSPVLHYLPELVQTHVYWVSDAIQPSHSLLPFSLLALNLFQNQGLFQWVCSSHQVAEVLELQLQQQSLRWINSVQSFSRVWLFVIPWTAACQASLSITNSWSLLKLMSIESVMPFNHLILFCPLLLLPSIFPQIRVFPLSQFFASGGQSFGVSASASVLPMNIQDWFPLGLVGLISMQSKGLSRVFSNTTVQKHQFFSAQFSL